MSIRDIDTDTRREFAGLDAFEQVDVTFDVTETNINQFPIEPAVAERVEYSITSNTEQHTDQCGRTETNRTGDNGVELAIEGRLTLTQAEGLIRARQLGVQIFVTSNLFTGDLFINDLTLTEHADQNYIEIDGEKEQVCTFQLQLQSESSEE